MTATSRFTVAFLIAAVWLCSFEAWQQAHGFFSESAIRLWARALLEVGGPEGYKAPMTLFAPVPLLSTMTAQLLVGATTVPASSITAVLAAAVMLALWQRSLTGRVGYSDTSATLIVALMALNPMFLRGVSEGPHVVFLGLGYWVFTRSLVSLRLSAAAPDMINVTFGLLIMSLSSGYGMIAAIAALPFIALSARPSLFLASPTGYMLTMGFPVLITGVSFIFIGVIFGGVIAVPAALTAPEPGLAPALAAFAAAALPALLAVGMLRHVPSYAIPLACAVATTASAMLLAAAIELPVEPVLAAVPLLSVTMVATAYWPNDGTRPAGPLLVLAFAWVAGMCAIAASPVPATAAWRAAAMGRMVPATEAARVAALLRGQNGVLIDAFSNPELIVALGGTRGLIANGMPGYELTLGGSRPDQPLIVARLQTASAGPGDSLARRFPNLNSIPPRGYRSVYADGEWVVLQHQPDPSGRRQVQ